MTRWTSFFCMAIALASASRADENAVPTGEARIAGAVAAAPEDRRAEARVIGFAADGTLEVLREGSNEIICLADTPGDERFQAVCYHKSLEPFMARGRQLRAAGVEDTLAVRHQEADAGTLQMPEQPVALYNLNGGADVFDPETGAVEGASWLWVVYTPYATTESTGLPTTEQAPGGPWIMRPGTASAHIMIVQPKSRPAES